MVNLISAFEGSEFTGDISGWVTSCKSSLLSMDLFYLSVSYRLHLHAHAAVVDMERM